MKQIDLKKLDTAITYLSRIAEGKNPINNLPAEDDDVLNNPNVIRCMYFIKDILEEVKKNSGMIGEDVSATFAKHHDGPRASFWYIEDQTLSAFVRHVNIICVREGQKKLQYKMVLYWLIQNGYMEEKHLAEFGKLLKLPTEKGIQLGIRPETKTTANGYKYVSVLFNEQAQRFIVQNLHKIIREADNYNKISMSREDGSFNYLKALSDEARQFVISQVEKGEPNIYHSLMSFIKNRPNSTIEEIKDLYFKRYESARPYLSINRNLVDEVINLCWQRIHG